MCVDSLTAFLVAASGVVLYLFDMNDCDNVTPSIVVICFDGCFVCSFVCSLVDDLPLLFSVRLGHLRHYEREPVLPSSGFGMIESGM